MGFAPSSMQLTSPAFKHNEPIDEQFTGEGEDISPALFWKNAPAATKSFALICHDPDAPLVSSNGTYGFVHWVLYNIPASVLQLAEGTKAYTAGKNDFGRFGYGGPMPPEGHGEHKYYFWLLALDKETDLAPGLTLWQLLQKIEPNVIAMNRLVGTYQRK